MSEQKVAAEHLQHLQVLIGKEYTSKSVALADIKATLKRSEPDIKNYELGVIQFWILKNAVTGSLRKYTRLYLLLSLMLATMGGLLYIIPHFFDNLPGIKNNNIWFSSTTGRGAIGITIGSLLIVFYVLLYWFPQYIVNVVVLVDPVSYFIRNLPADQWFLYGFLYTVTVFVMGLRMLAKYRHSRYHIVRTISIMFFQTIFAFILPSLMERLSMPGLDLKNAWPLNYYFFADWNIRNLLSSGNLGVFMFVWGIVLSIVLVPVLTYFFGKRWYCSWVCGCGGLAETMGDPFRQLSNKSLRAWKVERISIYGVLVFASVMTILQIVSYSTNGTLFGGLSGALNQVYSFLIGAAFAGVIGTGFYPFMGNRVWCRFGCPLAAIMGIVQRFKSRFRITTNGGQCISCGNCSTYCEMGIDVRAYAQRGENIVRASCVGCGVCAAVCPRGVLRLENGPVANRFNLVKLEPVN
ncbi:MAG: 4Fe-4S binding protein [Deferribacteres bacterium]|nr:4Fe-4S binding protein [candidate division KSB1 bacterium]MCB9500310.1 4Fe-4S binding protein [Deferribacteres bacterium]